MSYDTAGLIALHQLRSLDEQLALVIACACHRTFKAG